jgi:hypothetical protein
MQRPGDPPCADEPSQDQVTTKGSYTAFIRGSRLSGSAAEAWSALGVAVTSAMAARSSLGRIKPRMKGG